MQRIEARSVFKRAPRVVLAAGVFFLRVAVAGPPTLLSYVADRSADPAGWGGDAGAVFAYDGSALLEWIASPAWVDPCAAATDSAGNLFVLDAASDPLNVGSPTGAIYRFDPVTRQVVLYAASRDTLEMTDLALAGDGRIFVTGRAAAGPGGQLTGVVFVVDPNGQISVHVASTQFSEPTGVAVAAPGELIVVDRSAAAGGTGHVGAVFRVLDSGQIEVLATSAWFADLQDVVLAADGQSFLVADAEADPQNLGYDGAVFRVTAGGAVSVHATSPLFAHPCELVSRADGGILLLDSATDAGLPGGPRGVVFHVAAAGDVSIHIPASPGWQQATGLATEGSGTVARLGDLDGDGDVDLADFTVFQLCYGGSSVPAPTPCRIADFDSDLDVDLSDFAIFQVNFTGSF